ncbi:hypothetical protein ACH5RR_030354 [Cinchona calisaya]|uniref:Reverse transcriptase zinc-binding domain-containing protein n=1 Tax=Cinchona calisaya TaxID=153742 RepID=A0ABD2YVJ6_9GENT
MNEVEMGFSYQAGGADVEIEYLGGEGPLYKEFSEQLLKSFGISKNAKVENSIHEGTWKWPTGRKLTSKIRRLKVKTPVTFIPHPTYEDKVLWASKNIGIYTTKSAMKKIRRSRVQGSWHKLVWGKNSVPRFSFILWLLCKRKLTTKDQLKKWGIVLTNDKCELCSDQAETMVHLFFGYQVYGLEEDSKVLPDAQKYSLLLMESKELYGIPAYPNFSSENSG